MLLEISKFLRETGMSEQSFGRKFNGEHRLVEDLRNGRELRPRTIARLRAFISNHKEPSSD